LIFTKSKTQLYAMQKWWKSQTITLISQSVQSQ